MIRFYQEDNGDFLAIDTETNRYFRENFGKDHFEGRATAIAGVVSSVCTTGFSRGFFGAKCRRVAEAKVPGNWRNAIGY